jgi:hypothetical protein
LDRRRHFYRSIVVTFGCFFCCLAANAPNAEDVLFIPLLLPLELMCLFLVAGEGPLKEELLNRKEPYRGAFLSAIYDLRLVIIRQ